MPQSLRKLTPPSSCASARDSTIPQLLKHCAPWDFPSLRASRQKRFFPARPVTYMFRDPPLTTTMTAKVIYSGRGHFHLYGREAPSSLLAHRFLHLYLAHRLLHLCLLHSSAHDVFLLCSEEPACSGEERRTSSPSPVTTGLTFTSIVIVFQYVDPLSELSFPTMTKNNHFP